MALIPERRATDAAVLVRSLYETVVTFAWVAIDPAEHAPAWVRWDRRQRIRADNDLADHGAGPLLEPEIRRAFEASLAAGSAMPASLAERAEAVDQHWGQVVDALGTSPTSTRSFRGLYRYLYRSESQHSHAAVAPLEPLITNAPASGQFYVLPVERDPGDFTPFTRAPMIFALGLLVAAQALSLGNIEPELEQVFAV